MKLRLLARYALLTLAFALAATALGWWSAALLGLVWGALGTRRPVLEAGVSAVLGWAGLLALASGPEMGRLMDILGRLAPVPGEAFLVLSLLIGGALAALGAAVTSRAPRDRSFRRDTVGEPPS